MKKLDNINEAGRGVGYEEPEVFVSQIERPIIYEEGGKQQISLEIIVLCKCEGEFGLIDIMLKSY